MIDGLPPGPIANPGRASIEAAANPARTKEMFFVADGTGGHVFAETYDQHLQERRAAARDRGDERNAAARRLRAAAARPQPARAPCAPAAPRQGTQAPHQRQEAASRSRARRRPLL